MRITRDFQVSLDVFSHLDNLTQSSKILCKKVGTSEKFLQAQMTKLNQKGLIKIERGTQGGISLNKNKAEVTALEVMIALNRYPRLLKVGTDGYFLQHMILNLLKSYKVVPKKNTRQG